MNLNEVKLKTECLIKEINIEEEITKIRIMELGLVKGSRVAVIKKSILKKTLLIEFNYSCFTLKDNIAKMVIVNYA